MNERSRLVPMFLAALQLAPVFAQPGPVAHPYQIENTQVVSIQSQVLKRKYDLYVRLPDSYALQPTRTYPVLFFRSIWSRTCSDSRQC